MCLKQRENVVSVVAEAQDFTKKNRMKNKNKKNKMKMNKKKMIKMINVLMMTPSAITEVILAVVTMISSLPLVDSTTPMNSRPLMHAACVVEETSTEVLNRRVDQENHSTTNLEVHFHCLPKLLLQ